MSTAAMKLCLDLRTAENGYHGIARYGLELARALAELEGSPVLTALCSSGRSSAEAALQGRGIRFYACAAPPYGLLEQGMVPALVARIRPDLYHSPTYGCPLFIPVPFVLTIHDLLAFERPQDVSPTFRLYHRTVLRWVARRARRILTVSSYTRRLVCRRLGVPGAKVRTIHSGGDHVRRFVVSDADEAHYRRINPEGWAFFLSVANPRPHKNILSAVDSFLGSKALGREKVLYVLVGKQHPAVYARCSGTSRGGAARRIRFAGEVSHGLLRLLYERATALLCPSFGEGFCLPAVEAMQFGLPVLAADDGALPEVLGRVGILLPPRDGEQWEEAMVEVLAQRRTGRWDPSGVRERAKGFSWRRTAEETLAAYLEILLPKAAPAAGNKVRPGEKAPPC